MAAFRSVTEYFLGKNKGPNYKAIVETMLENLKKMGCNMSVKVHFLYSHIDYFPEILGHYSEERRVNVFIGILWSEGTRGDGMKL